MFLKTTFFSFHPIEFSFLKYLKKKLDNKTKKSISGSNIYKLIFLKKNKKNKKNQKIITWSLKIQAL